MALGFALRTFCGDSDSWDSGMLRISVGVMEMNLLATDRTSLSCPSSHVTPDPLTFLSLIDEVSAAMTLTKTDRCVTLQTHLIIDSIFVSQYRPILELPRRNQVEPGRFEIL